MTIHTININEAEGHLAELIDLVQKGEKIVISHKNQPLVELVIYNKNSEKRTPGLHKGSINMSNDFNDELEASFWTGQS